MSALLARAATRAVFLTKCEEATAAAFDVAHRAHVAALLAAEIVTEYGYAPEEIEGRITTEYDPARADERALYLATFKAADGAEFIGKMAPRKPSRLAKALLYGQNSGADLVAVRSLADVPQRANAPELQEWSDVLPYLDSEILSRLDYKVTEADPDEQSAALTGLRQMLRELGECFGYTGSDALGCVTIDNTLHGPDRSPVLGVEYADAHRFTATVERATGRIHSFAHAYGRADLGPVEDWRSVVPNAATKAEEAERP